MFGIMRVLNYIFMTPTITLPLSHYSFLLEVQERLLRMKKQEVHDLELIQALEAVRVSDEEIRNGTLVPMNSIDDLDND